MFEAFIYNNWDCEVFLYLHIIYVTMGRLGFNIMHMGIALCL